MKEGLWRKPFCAHELTWGRTLCPLWTSESVDRLGTGSWCFQPKPEGMGKDAHRLVYKSTFIQNLAKDAAFFFCSTTDPKLANVLFMMKVLIAITESKEKTVQLLKNPWKSLIHDLNVDNRNRWSTNSFKLLQKHKHVLCPIVCSDIGALIKIFLWADLVFLSIH